LRALLVMAKTHAMLAEDLKDFVEPVCPGVTVGVAESPRWKRTCLTFRWEGFRNLLLEERFRLVARQIPPDYFARNCRDAVWCELTPEETLEQFLAQPRSEDVVGRLPEIWRTLHRLKFFAVLEDELVRIPASQAPDDFTVTKRVLAARQASPDDARDALLAFMHCQAYTDWEVLRQVRPKAERERHE
jgi:hypothetical protein